MDKKYIRKRTEEVIKKSAIVTNLDDFLATHVPFEKLKYYTSGIRNDGETYYTEEELFNKFIIENRSKHNFIVVQGDNGSGKSHFIRWLKYKYDNELEDDSEISILIERNYNTLQGTIEQLLKNEVIQRYVNKEDIMKLSDAGNSISTKKFLSDINSSFANAVLCEEDDDCVLTKVNRKKLYAFLVNETVMEQLLLKADGPISRIGKKLSTTSEGTSEVDDIRFTEEDFTFTVYGELLTTLTEEQADGKVIRCAEDFASNKKGFKGNVVAYLNSKIEEVIQATIKLNTQDLNNMLFNIRTKLKEVNKNLTLFIEDITSFTGLDKAIIENLIIENTEDNGICRLFSVVGITQGYYEKNFPDNLKDRVTSRIIIDKESILGDENAILNISSRYLNAIYQDKKLIEQWIKNGAVESELPIVKPMFSWSKYKDKNQREFNIYPFNERAILNLFESLKVKTPRMVISHVIYPMIMEMTEGGTFPPSINEIKDKISIPEYTDQFIDLKINKALEGLDRERFKTLIRVWGNGGIDSENREGENFLGGINEEIFNYFNVPLISGNAVTARTEMTIPKIKNEPVKIIDSNNVTRDIPKVEVKVTEKTPPVVAEKNTKNTQFKLIADELTNWIKDGEEIKSHTKLRECVVDLIEEAIFWEMEEVSQYLVEDMITLSNVFIEGQVNKVNYNGYVINRTEENYYFLLSLIEYNYIGNKTWNFKGASQRIILVSKWIEKNKKKIIDFIKGSNKEKYDVYSYALLNNYYINCLIGDIKDKNIYDILVDTNIKVDENVLTNVLGEEKILYNKHKDNIEGNKDIVLRYYNCKLGDVKSNTTSTFYLDAKEILERAKGLKSKEWKLKGCGELALGEKWKLPNMLYKEYVSKKLINTVNDKFNEALEKAEIFDNIIGGPDRANDTFIEIKKFYKNLKDSNKYYDNELYKRYEEYFIKEYRMEYLTKVAKESSNKSYAMKVTGLKQGLGKRISNYLNIIQCIENFIERTLRENERGNELVELENKFQTTKNNLLNDLSDMEVCLDKVNGGGKDVIK